MKWFDRWFVRKCRWAWDHGKFFLDEPEKAGLFSTAQIPYNSAKQAHHRLQTDIASSGSRLSGPADLQFAMYHAENGYIMEVTRMDKRTERMYHVHYIIAEGEDLGDNISKIITLESLQK